MKMVKNIKLSTIFFFVLCNVAIAQQINPWNNFYKGDIKGAISKTMMQIDAGDSFSEKISLALPLLQFCVYSTDPLCAKPAFELYNQTENFQTLSERDQIWLRTEFQNGLIANSMQYPEIREIFRETRFESINYFTVGDGNITNFLNAQSSLALIAREESETVFSREVITRLIYLLSKLDEDQSHDYLRGQTLATIINISVQIGDLYTARQFYDLADEFIIEKIYHLKPYLYSYLYSTAQLLAASNIAEDQQNSIRRISIAKSVLEDGLFDPEMKLIEQSMLQTNQIFVALKLRDWANAKFLYETHPLQNNPQKSLKISVVHEMFFAATGYLLKGSEIINASYLPRVDVKDFQEEYSWESLESIGAILKFARLVSLYEHIKTHDGKIEEEILNEAFNVLLDQIQRDTGPETTLNTQPPFYFHPLAEYYLLEANVQKFSVGWVNLASLIDSLNRNPSQIYGDFLASAPPKGSSDYFIAHTLFDLSSNRLKVETSVVESIVMQSKVSEKQQDGLVKINTTIQSLSERAKLKWKKNDGSAYIQTDIRDGNALVFGYELGGYINMYCTDGINIHYSGGHKLQEISLAAQQLFNFLRSDGVFTNTSQQFPFAASVKLGSLFYNDTFSKCFSDGSKLTIVPFGPISGLPISLLLTQSYDGTFKEAPWAITTNSFSYASSIKEAFNAFFDSHDVATKNFFGLANPVFHQGSSNIEFSSMDASKEDIQFGTRSISVEGFLSLPETEIELKNIAQFFDNSKVITGDTATERSFRASHIASFDVLSFATHGVMSNEARGITDPSLILTQERKKEKYYVSPSTNGVLTAEEISKLNISASIVSLSACNTATQDVASSSKNVQSLSSAFRLAGADNVIATLWSVETQAAATLNVEMFRYWTSSNLTISESLRQAQLDYIFSASENEASPIFWSANIIVGAGQSVATKRGILDKKLALRSSSEIGYVSGIAIGKDERVFLSKNIQKQQGKLNPVIEAQSLNPDVSNLLLDTTAIHGSIMISESLGRNLALSISSKEDNSGKPLVAPMLSEYDDLGNLIWNYQYPFKDKTFTVMHSLSALPNGDVFAILHSSTETSESDFLNSHIGLVLSNSGRFKKEIIYYSSNQPQPSLRSLIVTPEENEGYFTVSLSINSSSATGFTKGDLGEIFSCAKPTSIIANVSLDNYQILSSFTVEDFWIDGATDTPEGIYFSGSKPHKCKFNFAVGGIAAIGLYNGGEFNLFLEADGFVPSKITDVHRSKDKIYFTQLWRPQVAGINRLDLESIDEKSDEYWDYSDPTEFEDSVYSFVGIGSWSQSNGVKINFLPINHFWAEGAQFVNERPVFFGQLGSRPSFFFTGLANR